MPDVLAQFAGAGKGLAAAVRLLAWAMWPSWCLGCGVMAVPVGGLGVCLACRQSWQVHHSGRSAARGRGYRASARRVDASPNRRRYCRACDGPLDFSARTIASPAGRCRCVLQQAGVHKAVCAWRYTAALAQALAGAKDRPRPGFFAALSDAMLEGSRMRRLLRAAVALVPVPSTQKRLRLRGFNPPTVLAERLGRLTGVPVWEGLTRPEDERHSHGDGGPQRGRSRDERLCSPPRFHATGHPPPGLLVVVDDVITTGATLRSAVEALGAAGATQVALVAAARRW